MTDADLAEAGQVGLACSAAPLLAAAAAIAASEQAGMPASLAVKPGGRVTSSELSSCSPSLRVSLRMKGLEAPALALVGAGARAPARRARAPGEAAQALPFGPEPTLKLARRVGVGGVRACAQGTRSAVVVEFAAGDRGRQRRPRARLEVDRQVAGRQLRVFGEGRGQLAGLLVGGGDARELEVDPVARRFRAGSGGGTCRPGPSTRSPGWGFSR